jgi:hypothetical protein
MADNICTKAAPLAVRKPELSGVSAFFLPRVKLLVVTDGVLVMSFGSRRISYFLDSQYDIENRLQTNFCAYAKDHS